MCGCAHPALAQDTASPGSHPTRRRARIPRRVWSVPEDMATTTTEAAFTPERTSGILLPVLCAASALAVTNAVALSPFLADMGGALGVSVAVLGQTLTVSGLLGAALGLFIGPLAERAGYHRVLLSGTIALVASNILTALATGIEMIVLAQLANGIAGATVSPIAFAYAGTTYAGEGRRRAISRIYATAAGAGVVALPLLAFVGDWASWRWSFGLLAGAALTFFLAALATLPRRQRDPSARLRPRAIVAVYYPILSHRPVGLLYLAQCMRGVCWTGMLSYIGAFINQQLGYALTAVMALMIALTFWLQADIGPTFVLLLLAATAGGAAEVVAATAISADSSAPQGPTMSLHSSILRAGTAMGALVGGGLLALGGYALLGFGLACAGLVGVACAWVSLRHIARSTQPVATGLTR
ncbi:MAG: hypothetical protein DCC58_18575 [Chloroflexi bacterium]|nr:MAG: hypothetical protein DCC58_18575 [Chloroflexota bacterium]